MAFKYTIALALVALFAIIGTSSAAPAESMMVVQAPLSDAPKVEAPSDESEEELEIFVQQVPEGIDDNDDDLDAKLGEESIPLPQNVLDALLEDFKNNVGEDVPAPPPQEEAPAEEAPVEAEPEE